MIGKAKVYSVMSCQAIRAVYFGATGGAGALLSRCVVSFELVAYEELA
jgi:fumarate hydratase subunit beta